MVVVPAGTVMMGSSGSEKQWAASHGGTLDSVGDEAPQHTVTVPSFAIGKYDVTRDEYATFVRQTKRPAGDGCYVSSMPRSLKRADASWDNPGFAQTGSEPAICVSWNDARAYIDWLNGRTAAQESGTYTLPSESKWEYAARAGSTSKFWWGDDEAEAAAYAWYKDNSGDHTHPVGSKPPNAFGLYDMAGNVWQWTSDCYAESYATAPRDGQPNDKGVSDPRPDGTHRCMRVDRGSSYLYPAWLLRSATRERNPDDFRDVIMGFRVAKVFP